MKFYIYPKNDIIYKIYIDILYSENIKYKTNYVKNQGLSSFEYNYIVQNIEVDIDLEKFDYIKDVAAKKAKVIADLESNYKIQLDKINNRSVRGLSKDTTIDIISQDLMYGTKQNFLKIEHPLLQKDDYMCKTTFTNTINQKSKSKIKKLKRILKLLFK